MPTVANISPNRNPFLRPMRCINRDAGYVATSIPKNINVIGTVAHSGSSASVAPIRTEVGMINVIADIINA